MRLEKPKKLSPEEKKSDLSEAESKAAKAAKARWARILKVYSLTKQQYEELDHGHCPICTRVWSDTVVPCIDHDHKTGKVRGLLCRYCNRYCVGRFRDPDVVQRIVDYLRTGLQSIFIMPPKPKKKRKKTIGKKDPCNSRSTRPSRLSKS